MSRHLLPSVRVAPFPCNSLLPSATTARLAMLVLGVLLICRPAAAQTPPADIIRVEEDWRVEIGVPDPNTDSPQIITVMSPTASIDGFHAIFEMNHRTQPDYFAGGLQLQCWNGEVPLCAHSSPNGSQMSTPQEVVTFTNKMHLEPGLLYVAVRNGSSTTWGTFGNSYYLATVENTTLSNLNDYSPNVSTKHSRIGFASHQVQRLVLTQVRYYTSEGLHTTDDTERVVHEYYATH